MKIFCLLVLMAIVCADDVDDVRESKRDIFLTPIRQTLVRPALINKVVQPVVHDIVQPVITQKEIRTFINPVQLQHVQNVPVMTHTLVRNGFVKSEHPPVTNILPFSKDKSFFYSFVFTNLPQKYHLLFKYI